MPRCVIINLLENIDKDKTLKAAREKKVSHAKARITKDFSGVTIEVKGPWSKIFKVPNGKQAKNSQPSILYPQKISLKNQPT